MSLAGDSGSAVLDLDNNIVGLLFAGDDDGTLGAAATIQNVLSELDISLNLLDCDNVPPPPLMGDANLDGQFNRGYCYHFLRIKSFL